MVRIDWMDSCTDAPLQMRPMLECVAAASIAAEGLTGCYQVGVTLVDDVEIRALNLRMRKIDRATDVLSFPTVCYPPGRTAQTCAKRLRRELDPETGCVQLGDIVISWPHAQGQAREYGHTPAREMGFLLAHGLLHLMGYDHMTEEDAQVMRAMEKKTMNQVHLTREQAPDAERMMALARTAREAAYVPYSGYAVGACLLAEDGRIFTGCNVENASYGLTQCAERNAVCKGVSEGARRFVALAIAAQGAMPYPCGACRQVLREFATLDMPVWVTCDGQQMQITLGELLPFDFGPESLNKQKTEESL